MSLPDRPSRRSQSQWQSWWRRRSRRSSGWGWGCTGRPPKHPASTRGLWSVVQVASRLYSLQGTKGFGTVHCTLYSVHCSVQGGFSLYRGHGSLEWCTVHRDRPTSTGGKCLWSGALCTGIVQPLQGARVFGVVHCVQGSSSLYRGQGSLDRQTV